MKERWTELCGPLVEHQNRIQPIVPFKLSRHQKRGEEAVVDVLSRVILTGLTQASSWWSVVALDADDDKWWILC